MRRVLGLCRLLYNSALEQRITAWQRCRISLSQYQQAAELKDIRAAMPEYAGIQQLFRRTCGVGWVHESRRADR